MSLIILFESVFISFFSSSIKSSFFSDIPFPKLFRFPKLPLFPFNNDDLKKLPKMPLPNVPLTASKSSFIWFLVFLIILFKSMENTPNKELCNPDNIWSYTSHCNSGINISFSGSLASNLITVFIVGLAPPLMGIVFISACASSGFPVTLSELRLNFIKGFLTGSIPKGFNCLNPKILNSKLYKDTFCVIFTWGIKSLCSSSNI